MKLIVLISCLSFIMSCSNITTRDDSLLIPKDGLELVQHTIEDKGRNQNSLYIPSREINKKEFGSKELESFIHELRKLMHQSNGIGIAANQVGKNIQIFLLEATRTDLWHEALESVPYQVFINPRITQVSEGTRNFWHGCLSAWGEKLGNVASYDWLEYEAYDASGVLRRGRLSGLAAVIFQHEMRHLLGGTYLDKAVQFMDSAELFVKADSGEVAFFEQASDELPVLLDDYMIGESLEAYYQRQSKWP